MAASIVDMPRSTTRPAQPEPGLQVELPLSAPDVRLPPRMVPAAVLAKHPRAGRPWSPAEVETLRMDLPRIGVAGVAHALMRPVDEVRERADEEGVHETAADRKLRRQLEEAGVPIEPSARRPRRGRASTWSDAEDAAILARYADEGPVGLAADPLFKGRRTCRAIEVRASRLEVIVPLEKKQARRSGKKTPRWTVGEDAIIDTASTVDDLPTLLLQMPGRTLSAVEARFRQRRGGKRVIKPWSIADDERLVELYAAHAPADVAELMGRTYAAVTNRATFLGITTKYQAWSAIDDAILRKGFHDTPLDLLAKRLKRTPAACQMRAGKLGLVELQPAG